MTDKNPYSSNVNINRGQVVAGNIGGSGNTGRIDGPVSIGAGDADQLAETIAALRTELTALRVLVVDAGSEAVEAGDVDDVIEAVEGDDPEPGRVVRRWRRLAALIPDPLRSVETVTKIVGLIEQLRTLAD